MNPSPSLFRIRIIPRRARGRRRRRRRRGKEEEEGGWGGGEEEEEEEEEDNHMFKAIQLRQNYLSTFVEFSWSWSLIACYDSYQ